MASRARSSSALAVAALVLLIPAGITGQGVPQPQFRTGVTAVTVPVRVVNSNGDPVADLTRTDFELLENGIRQDIAQFSTRAVSGDASVPPRTFVFILGFGNHEPSSALTKLIDFVGRALVPTDRVSLIAYLRGSTPSTDHRAVIRFLERYRAAYLSVEGRLRRDRSRLAGPMLPVSSDTVAAIDAVFADSSPLRFQNFPDAAGGKGLGYADLPLFSSALTFVRAMEGEKHVIWLLDQRVALGRDGASPFARAAIASGATLSVITTGGDKDAGQTVTRGRVSQTAPNRWAFTIDATKTAHARDLAELTGGIAAFYSDVGKQLARVARVTAFEYLLGYQPANPPAVGEYRDIKVVIHRPGVQMLYQHGVEPRPEPAADIDIRTILTDSRLRAAAESSFEYKAIPVKITTTSMPGGEAGQLAVQLEIDPKRVFFASADGRKVASLDVVVFLATSERLVAERRERLEITPTRKLVWTTTFDNREKADQIKTVVYDYDSDRLGTASLRVR